MRAQLAMDVEVAANRHRDVVPPTDQRLESIRAAVGTAGPSQDIRIVSGERDFFIVVSTGRGECGTVTWVRGAGRG